MSAVTCRQFVEFLADYLGGELPAAERDEFNAHLSACPSCVTYMKTYQETIRAGKSALTASDEPVPESIPEGLVRAILAARSRKDRT